MTGAHEPLFPREMETRNPSQQERAEFWARVDMQELEQTTCWLWMGYRTSKGYGRFYFGGRYCSAHRWAYVQSRGEIPAGKVIDHLCRNRACVNPGHMQPVSSRVNVLRGVGRTAKNAKKTHCARGHAFSPENTRMSNGKRYCKACNALHHSQGVRMRKRDLKLALEEAYDLGAVHGPRAKARSVAALLARLRGAQEAKPAPN